MANYSVWVEYFETLAIQNNLIQHELNGNKKFYRMNIEELFIGSTNQLPAPSEGPFLILINYISALDDTEKTGRVLDKKDLMFVVLRGVNHNDFDHETASYDVAEEAADQIILKMNDDSKNGLEPFEYGFDTIKAKKIPFKIFYNRDYVGYQVACNPFNSFNKCHDENNWTIP